MGLGRGPGEIFECVASGLLPGDAWGWDKPWKMQESVTLGSLPGDVVRLHLLGCAF